MAQDGKTKRKPRRIKEKHPKVRTGCLTCKRRHVKCDEKRPECDRCERGKYKCEGYPDAPKAWIFEYTRPDEPERDISNDVDSSTDSDKEATASDPGTGVTTFATSIEQPLPTLVKVDSEPAIRLHHPNSSLTKSIKPSSPYDALEDQRALKYFVEKTAPILTRYADPEVWLTVIPQAAYTNEAVRQCLIACSLVDQAVEHPRGRPKYGNDSKALFYVNSAIRSLTTQSPPTEVMLMAGLILQLLETLNHNARLAMIHLQSAVNILMEYKQKLADGIIEDKSQAELILTYLDPTIMIAVKFAEQTLAAPKTADANRIDLYSAEAFSVRAKMTHPSISETFISFNDAKKRLITISDQLTDLRAKYHPFFPQENRRQSTSSVRRRAPAVPSRRELYGVSSLLEHFMRLYAPVHDEDQLPCRLLMVHAQILRMMLQDTSHQPYEDQHTYDPDNGDKLLAEMMALTESSALVNDTDFQRDLGLIPPLFYLASHSKRCTLLSRRQAVSCIREHLSDRSEGDWSGKLAASIAEEIIDIEEGIGYDVVLAEPSLEALDQHGDMVDPPYHTDEDLAVWLSYVITHFLPPSFMEDKDRMYIAIPQPERKRRRCTSWMDSQASKLPKNVNNLIRDFGYQALRGYFPITI